MKRVLLIVLICLWSCSKSEDVNTESNADVPIERVTLIMDVVNEDGESLLSPDAKGNWTGKTIIAFPKFLSFPFEWIVGKEYDEYQRQYIDPKSMSFTVEEYDGRPYCVLGPIGRGCDIIFSWPTGAASDKVIIKETLIEQEDGSRKKIGQVFYEGKEVGPNFTVTVHSLPDE